MSKRKTSSKKKIDPEWSNHAELITHGCVPDFQSEEGMSDEINIEEEVAAGTAVLIINFSAKRGSSEVWKHFGTLYKDDILIDKLHVYCSECFAVKIVKRYKTTTSTNSLLTHMKLKHHLDVKCRVPGTSQPKELKTQYKKQKIIHEVSEPSTELCHDIALWFSTDLVPFNNLCLRGMIAFFQKYGIGKSGQSLPDPSNIRRRAFNQVYDWVYKAIKEIVLDIRPAITIDMWTDSSRRLSFISYAVHWIDRNWQIQSAVIKSSFFDHQYSENKIARSFLNVIADFNIDESSIVAVVADAELNLLCSLDSLNFKRIPCIAYSLRDLIEKDLFENEQMIPVISLVNKFQQCQTKLIYKQNDLSGKYQKRDNEIVFTLLEELSTVEELLESDCKIGRVNIEDASEDHLYSLCLVSGLNPPQPQMRGKYCWNSILVMVKAFAENRVLIGELFEDLELYDMVPGEDEYKLTEDLINLLEIFKAATDILQGGKYPMNNLILLFLTEIKDRLQLFEEEAEGILAIAVLILKENLDKRFPVSDHIVCAAILDPGSQHLDPVNQYLISKKETKASFLSRICAELGISTSEKIAVPSEVKNEVDTKNWRRSRFELLSKHSSAPKSAFETEVARYENTAEIIVDPIKWWGENQNNFPVLNKVARFVLSVPATCASSARVFSETGSIETVRRLHIDPVHVQEMIFIHENIELVQKID